MTLDEIKEKLDNSKNILVLVHDNPDGDAIGSGVAMYLALKNMGKEVDFILPSYPSCFREVLNLDSIVKQDEDVKDSYDLAISLDCASTKQVHLYDVYEKVMNTISYSVFENYDVNMIMFLVNHEKVEYRKRSSKEI